jgi:hypothetical protein
MRSKAILVLVLGLASVSQAYIVWFEVDSSTPVPSVGTSGTIQINLVTDFTCYGWQIGLMASTDTAGTIDGSPQDDAMYGGITVGEGYIINSSESGYAKLFDCAAGVSTGGNAAGIQGSFDYVLPSGWIIPFTIGVLPEGTTYHDAWGDEYKADPSYAASATGSVDLPGIPEPATLLLLGLGAVMLRKRR